VSGEKKNRRAEDGKKKSGNAERGGKESLKKKRPLRPKMRSNKLCFPGAAPYKKKRKFYGEGPPLAEPKENSYSGPGKREKVQKSREKGG